MKNVQNYNQLKPVYKMTYKIITKPIDVYEIDSTGEGHIEYMIYVTDEKYNPIEAQTAYGQYDRNAVVTQLIELYEDISEITHKKYANTTLDG